MGVYKGSKNLGDELRRMLTQGKQIQTQERDRWMTNRAFYMGDQYLQNIPGLGLRQQAPSTRLKSGRRRDTVNRSRQFIDGRVALLSKEVPPYEVVPANMAHDEYKSAQVAERYVGYEWSNGDGWNILHHRRRLCLAGEQDGIAFLNVRYDPDAGPEYGQEIPFAPNPESGKWEPVTDRSDLDALKAQDPDGGTLWKPVRAPMGDVVWRVVRASKLAVDPDVRTDWRRCRWVVESDVWPVEKLEKRAGKPLDALRNESARTTRTSSPTLPGTVSVEDGYSDRAVAGSNSVLVHEVFIAPQGPGSDWPDGAHIIVADLALNTPIVEERWDTCVPYYPYTPKPDGLNLLRSRGTMDELRPLQIMLNRLVSAVNEWMDKLARPPLVLNGGSVRSNTPIFNEDGVIMLNPGFSDPHFMVVPGEPANVINNYIAWVLQQMAEISVQSDVTRGTPVGGDPSGAALDVYDRNNEMQLSGTESELKAVIEWGVNTALRLVGKHFKLERSVSLPGVNGEDEVIAIRAVDFQGDMRFRITGSTLPRSREQRRQALLEAAAATGGRFDLTRFIPELVDGDVDQISRRLKAQGDRQANENRQILALGRHPLRDQIWQSFSQQRDMWMTMVQTAAQDPNVADPIGFMTQQGFPPPRVTDMLLKIAAESKMAKADAMRVPGMPMSDPSNWPEPVEIPTVEPEFDDAVEHITGLNDICLGDGYHDYHDLVKQVIKEHREDHLKQIAKTEAANEQPEPDPTMEGS